jgi:hypothetical protein
MKPGQKKWKSAVAKQYISVNPPAFDWSMKLKIAPLLYISARDQFRVGKGDLGVTLMSLIPVSKVKSNPRVDQASLQRFLAEIVWYPSAARLSCISWEALDENSARATMGYGGTSGSGIFYFDEQGDFHQFSAMRYKDTDPQAPLVEWVVTNELTEQRDGFRIPVKLSATWKLDQGDWTWIQIAVRKIKFGR